VKSLHNLRPSPEDRSTLADFQGDVATLGKVEQFFILVKAIISLSRSHSTSPPNLALSCDGCFHELF
jgi:hypothetical protein